MNWREVLAMPPAMKSVVPVTAALRAKRLRGESGREAMVGCSCRYVVVVEDGARVAVGNADARDRKSGVR